MSKKWDEETAKLAAELRVAENGDLVPKYSKNGLFELGDYPAPHIWDLTLDIHGNDCERFLWILESQGLWPAYVEGSDRELRRLIFKLGCDALIHLIEGRKSLPGP